MAGPQARSYRVIGAPFELGSRCAGAGRAPDSLREAGLTSLIESVSGSGVDISDVGDVAAPDEGDSSTNPRNLAQLLSYSEELMPRLAEIYASGSCPVVVGGDHAVSVPSVSAAARHLRNSAGDDAELGLVWVDAHPDLETPETTPSGDLHGMSAAVLLGMGAHELTDLGGFSPKVRPENVAMIGLRDVMRSEGELIESLGIVAYTASDMERLGTVPVFESVFARMADRVSGFVLSFDVDVCDPLEAPGVEYPERGGLTFREMRLLAEMASEASGLMCIEVVEAVPNLDAAGATSRLAASFIRWVVRGSPLRPATLG